MFKLWKVRCEWEIEEQQRDREKEREVDVDAEDEVGAREQASGQYPDATLFTVIGYYRGDGKYHQMKWQETERIDEFLNKEFVERKYVVVKRPNRTRRKLSRLGAQEV